MSTCGITDRSCNPETPLLFVLPVPYAGTIGMHLCITLVGSEGPVELIRGVRMPCRSRRATVIQTTIVFNEHILKAL